MGFLSSLFGIGGGSSKPATQQVVQTSKLPEEISPFAKDILERAQAEFERRTAEGYTPYEGATIAPFTPEEEAAQAGIKSLVGTSRPLQEEALAITRQQQQQFTPEVAEQFMSPYQRAVTDIEKREAQRVFERDIMPQIEAQAVAAGGMSGLGTRAALQASEAQRNQAQLLADIEAKGLQSAFQDARMAFEQQKARERAQASDIFSAGPAMFTSGLAEQGALQTVGEQKRDLAQSALDEEYFKFLEEQAFPQERLAEYSGFVYGNPLLQQRTRTTTGTFQQAQPSLGRQLLGLAGTAAGLYGMAGGFSPAGPSMATFDRRMFGGNRKTGGGLSDLVKRFEGGGLTGKPLQAPELPEIFSKKEAKKAAEVRAKLRELQEAREEQIEGRDAVNKELARLRSESPSSLTSVAERVGAGLLGTQQELDAARARQEEAAIKEATMRQNLRNLQTDSSGKPTEQIFDTEILSTPLPGLTGPDIGITQALPERAKSKVDPAKQESPDVPVAGEKGPDIGLTPPERTQKGSTGTTRSVTINDIMSKFDERGEIINAGRQSIANADKELSNYLNKMGENARKAGSEQNKINFYQSIINFGLDLASSNDNAFKLLGDQASKYFDKRNKIEADIITKEGQGKLNALKAKAENARKDINLLLSMNKNDTEKLKALADWQKATLGSSATNKVNKLVLDAADALIDTFPQNDPKGPKAFYKFLTYATAASRTTNDALQIINISNQMLKRNDPELIGGRDTAPRNEGTANEVSENLKAQLGAK